MSPLIIPSVVHSDVKPGLQINSNDDMPPMIPPKEKRMDFL